LINGKQPAIKYLALTELLGRAASDPVVESARESIPNVGWCAKILREQKPGGWWVSEQSLSRPKYTATYWMLLMLADLGLTRAEPRVEKACQLWIERSSKNDGGFGYDRARTSEMCITGSTARALIRFGYVDHPRVKSAIEWLLRDQKENGGWRCGWRNGIIDGWEALSAFEAYPRQKWSRRIKRAVEDGAEFYLSRELHKEGKPYGPWYRFHYPTHYYYDILVGLDLLTALGYGTDRRLCYALTLLKNKRRSDGRWNLDAVHPDLEGKIAELYAMNPPIPYTLEDVGRPSLMITLRALRVLGRAESES